MTTAARARSGQSPAGEVGDGDEGFPGVGGAVLDGHGGLGAFQLVEVGAEPVGAARRPSCAGRAVAAVPVRGDRSRRGAAAHADDDGAVLDGVGHGADAGERGHGEGGDAFDAAGVLAS